MQTSVADASHVLLRFLWFLAVVSRKSLLRIIHCEGIFQIMAQEDQMLETPCSSNETQDKISSQMKEPVSNKLSDGQMGSPCHITFSNNAAWL